LKWTFIFVKDLLSVLLMYEHDRMIFNWLKHPVVLLVNAFDDLTTSYIHIDFQRSLLDLSSLLEVYFDRFSCVVFSVKVDSKQIKRLF